MRPGGAQLLCGVWDLPGPGNLTCCLLHWQVDSITEPPGKPSFNFLMEPFCGEQCFWVLFLFCFFLWVLISACKQFWICKSHRRHQVQRGVQEYSDMQSQKSEAQKQAEIMVNRHWPECLYVNGLSKTDSFLSPNFIKHSSVTLGSLLNAPQSDSSVK